MRYDKSHLSKEWESGGLNHEVQLLGAEIKQCIVPKDEGDSTCRSQQQVKRLKYRVGNHKEIRIVL